MTTDDLAQSLPASRLIKGTTAFLLAMAVALASTVSFAKTPASPAKSTAAKPSVAGKKSVPATKAKAKPASTASRDHKADATRATATTVDAPVKETLVASPSHALAPSPTEAVGSDMPAKAQAAIATPSADAGNPRQPAPPSVTADKPVAAAKGGIRELASDAAASTLTLLLPHIAAGDDALPLLGRSTEVASDLGRLLSGQGKATTPPPSDKVQSVLKRALTLLGTPYRWGGTSPDSGFDCSGLVGYVFRTALGIELPRVSRDMARNKDALLIKSRDELREGDLVFFGRGKSRIDHVGIYLGDGMFVHAPRTGKDVEVSSLATGYWSTKFKQARRVEM